jgi:hypothetical protein
MHALLASPTTASFPAHHNFLDFTILAVLGNEPRGSVSIANRLQPEGWGDKIRFPTEATDFSIPHNLQTEFGARPHSYTMGTGGCFPDGKMAQVWSWPLTSI